MNFTLLKHEGAQISFQVCSPHFTGSNSVGNQPGGLRGLVWKSVHQSIEVHRLQCRSPACTEQFILVSVSRTVEELLPDSATAWVVMTMEHVLCRQLRESSGR